VLPTLLFATAIASSQATEFALSVAGGWWLVAGGWWLVAGGWWLIKPKISNVSIQFCTIA
jgi:hypothetical protein